VGTPYDPAFYGRHRDGSASSARAILPRVAEWVAPRSVVDVGCGLGSWLAAWGELGVADVVGVEGGHLPEDGLAVPRERVLVRDLEQPFDLGRTFDLAMSLEVAEHLRPASAEGFVASLAALAPVVLFSAAIPFQGGTGHRTERWPAWWAERFAALGYRGVDCVRPLVWTDERVAPWYAQNAILYVREDRLAAFPSLHAIAERQPAAPLPLVHPWTYLRRADPARASFGKALRFLGRGIANALVRRRSREAPARTRRPV
jgi:SAM-dependent methyltransferase